MKTEIASSAQQISPSIRRRILTATQVRLIGEIVNAIETYTEANRKAPAILWCSRDVLLEVGHCLPAAIDGTMLCEVEMPMDGFACCAAALVPTATELCNA